MSTSRNKNIKLVDKRHTFPIKTFMDSTGAREALRFGPVNTTKINIDKVISYLSTLRNKLKTRIPPFPFFELLANFQLLDKVSFIFKIKIEFIA